MDIVQYFLLPVHDLSIAVEESATPRASQRFEILGEHSTNLVTRLLGRSVSLSGSMSPIARVTLPTEAKRAAGIPAAAEFFAFAYPLQDLTEAFDSLMKSVFSSITHGHDDDMLFFMLLGGFCYFDADRKFLHANALSLKPSALSLWLEGPWPATAGSVDALRSRDRLQCVRTKALRRGGVEKFAWVHPNERPNDKPLCAQSAVEWEHGALLFEMEEGLGSLFYRVRVAGASSVTPPIRADGGAEVSAALRTLNNSYNVAAEAFSPASHIHTRHVLIRLPYYHLAFPPISRVARTLLPGRGQRVTLPEAGSGRGAQGTRRAMAARVRPLCARTPMHTALIHFSCLSPVLTLHLPRSTSAPICTHHENSRHTHLVHNSAGTACSSPATMPSACLRTWLFLDAFTATAPGPSRALPASARVRCHSDLYRAERTRAAPSACIHAQVRLPGVVPRARHLLLPDDDRHDRRLR